MVGLLFCAGCGSGSGRRRDAGQPALQAVRRPDVDAQPVLAGGPGGRYRPWSSRLAGHCLGSHRGPTAYTRTETAWRGHDLVPFKPWFDTGRMLFGPVLGVLAPFVFTALFVLVMMSRPVRAMGTELRLWCACYMGYLLVFLHPQTSTFRMLLPLFPLALRWRCCPNPKRTGGPSWRCSSCSRSSGWCGCGRGLSCPAAGTIRPDVELCRASGVCTKSGQMRV